MEVFDDIWEKVYAAEVQALKDKYEGELKKEIKKLQRLRDQIKTWVSSNDIKDKSALVEARKLIESKMEQFKICEKETKTKAYSKEGLAREDKLDPREQERLNKQEWAQSCIERLTDLNEALDGEVDKIASGKTKGKARGDAIEKLENRMMNNRWHIEKLEQIIRVLEADLLEPALVDDIKEDVEFYLENAVDDDAAPDENEFDIYEELQLDSLKPGPPEGSALALAATEKVSSDDEAAADEKAGDKSEGDAAAKAAAKGKTPVKAAAATNIIGLATGVKQPAAKAVVVAPAKVAAPVKQPPTVAAAAPAPVVVAAAAKLVAPEKAPLDKKVPAPVVDYKKASTKGPEPVKEVKTEPAGPWAGPAKAATALAVPIQQADKPPPQTAPSLSVDKPFSAAVHTQPVIAPPIPVAQGVAPTTAPIKQASPSVGPSPPSQSAAQNQSAPKPPIGPDINSAVNRALKMSMFFTAPGAENDNRPAYGPRNPGPTHPLFPTQPAPIVESAALYESLPMDSLFLAFYYQQGSYHQYLAAKQLKKHSWRFHKKYMTWFQRHEEPKLTTDEYEEGTYVYFDYESGWCQRIKSEFKFEYCYLEDEM